MCTVHVEYYFKGDGKYLTFPWDKGFTMEDAERYYDEADYYDYIHTLSRTPILKAQHPDFEIAQQGIHAQRGVSCADCHMPYKSEGGVKFSDHHITSPLANIDRTCQTCHRESEEVLRQNVYDRQRKANEIRNKLEDELAKAHIEAKFAWDKGATEAEMKPVLKYIRQSQWRWDYGVASHGASFLPRTTGDNTYLGQWSGTRYAGSARDSTSIGSPRLHGSSAYARHFDQRESTALHRVRPSETQRQKAKVPEDCRTKMARRG